MSRVAVLVFLVVMFEYVGKNSAEDFQSCTGIETLTTLLRSQLKKVAPDWSQLGTELNIQQHALEIIRQDWTGSLERFRAMITLWYNNSTAAEHCWETIITALKAIDQLALANELGNTHGVFDGPLNDIDEETVSSEWSFYKTSMPIDPEGKKIVNASKDKRGIAIVINCDYENTDSPLPGTNRDAEEMKNTLEVLKFHIVTLHNPTQTEIRTKIKKISSALPLLETVSPANFKAIMFVFSGHGTDPDKILSQDEKELGLKADIVKPLIGHRRIKHIPKLFFVDACRGGEHLKQVSPKAPIEEEANYRIDYSTVPRHYSYMVGNKSQSEWLPTLAYELRTNKDSVQNIVATVNQRVFDRTQRQLAQQGEGVDRLNVGPLYLHPEVDKDSERFHTEL